MPRFFSNIPVRRSRIYIASSHQRPWIGARESAVAVREACSQVPELVKNGMVGLLAQKGGCAHDIRELVQRQPVARDFIKDAPDVLRLLPSKPVECWDARKQAHGGES